jgi:cyanophycin synthetase
MRQTSIISNIIKDLIIDLYPGKRKTIDQLVVKWFIRSYVAMLRIPVIAITGTNGKTTVSRLIEKTLLNAGYNVGSCNTEGVNHNGVQIWKGDASWGYGVWKAARCPNVDLLVVETARGGIVRYGLGFKRCQVGVVTNVYEDHLGFDGINSLEEMAEVKSTIPQHTDIRGSIVLNGDDAFVRDMACRSRAAPIYFVLRNDYKKFDRVFYLKDSCIFKKNKNEDESCVMDIKDIPITFGGKLNFNIANVMAALAAVEGIQRFVPIKIKSIKKTLKEFGNSPFDNMNRFCMVTFKGESVVLSYSKNPESYRNDIEVIKRIMINGNFENSVGVLTGPGNRKEKYYKEISEIVAPVCDYFFIRPPKQQYLRCRNGEEIVKLFSESIPGDKILSEKQSSLSEVISLSKEKLEGRTLFIVFYAALEADIDYLDVINDSIYHSQMQFN